MKILTTTKTEFSLVVRGLQRKICQHFRNSRHAVLKSEDDKYFFKSFKQQQTGLGNRQPLNDISILHEIWVDFADEPLQVRV